MILRNICCAVIALVLATTANAEVFVFEQTRKKTGRVRLDMAIVAVDQADALAARQLLGGQGRLGDMDPSQADYFVEIRQIANCTKTGWYATILLGDSEGHSHGGSCGMATRRAAVLAAVQTCLGKSKCSELLRSDTRGIGTLESGYDPGTSSAVARFNNNEKPPKALYCDKSAFHRWDKSGKVHVRCFEKGRTQETEPREIDLLDSDKYWFED